MENDFMYGFMPYRDEDGEPIENWFSPVAGGEKVWEEMGYIALRPSFNGYGDKVFVPAENHEAFVCLVADDGSRQYGQTRIMIDDLSDVGFCLGSFIRLQDGAVTSDPETACDAGFVMDSCSRWWHKATPQLIWGAVGANQHYPTHADQLVCVDEVYYLNTTAASGHLYMVLQGAGIKYKLRPEGRRYRYGSTFLYSIHSTFQVECYANSQCVDLRLIAEDGCEFQTHEDATEADYVYCADDVLRSMDTSLVVTDEGGDEVWVSEDTDFVTGRSGTLYSSWRACENANDEEYEEDEEDEYYGSRLQSYHQTEPISIANADGFRVGVEFETEDDCIRATFSGFNSDFRCEADCSLNDWNGVEVVTPTFNFPSQWEEVCSHLRNSADTSIFAAEGSSRCSGHVNVSHTSIPLEDLCASALWYVPLLAAMYPKRAHNTFCPIKSLFEDWGRKFGTISFHQHEGAENSRLEFRIFPQHRNETLCKRRVELACLMASAGATSYEEAMANTAVMQQLLVMYGGNSKKVARVVAKSARLAVRYDFC